MSRGLVGPSSCPFPWGVAGQSQIGRQGKGVQTPMGSQGSHTEAIIGVLASSETLRLILVALWGHSFSPPLVVRSWSIRCGSNFMTNKMELTPDKDYVWGKPVVQGVSLSA